MYELIKDFAGPAATATAAVIAAFITVRIQREIIAIQRGQEQIARAKLKFDLFDRRFAYYNVARNMIIRVTEKASFDLEELFEFKRGWIGAEFLFSKSTMDYVAELFDVAANVQACRIALDDPECRDRLERAQKLTDGLVWLHEQSKQIGDKFSTELRLAV